MECNLPSMLAWQESTAVETAGQQLAEARPPSVLEVVKRLIRLQAALARLLDDPKRQQVAANAQSWLSSLSQLFGNTVGEPTSTATWDPPYSAPYPSNCGWHCGLLAD